MDFKFDNIANNSINYEFVLKDTDHLSPQEKNYESIKVPGRTGNVIVDDGSYKNKVITDVCYLITAVDKMYVASKEIAIWLQGKTGYKLLEYNDGARYNAICKKLKIRTLTDEFSEVTIQYEAFEVIQ